MAALGGLRTIGSWREYADSDRRPVALLEQVCPDTPGLRRALLGLRTTIIAGRGGMGGS